MLVPTSSIILISEDQRDESINTIKVDFAKMSFVKSTKENYTQCSHCCALLTLDDKKHISAKNLDSEGNALWICRFCKKQNKNRSIYFVSSNLKHCLAKNLSTKIVPPIILFLIDISGSMTSSIYTDIWTKSQQAKGKSRSLITKQMKKIIEDSIMRKNEAQYLTQLHKSFGNNNKINQYDKLQHFSKLSFLFSIIEYHLKILKNKKQKSQFRVGFIFFSDSLTVLKGAKQKHIPMYVDSSDVGDQMYPFQKQKIDFNNCSELFEKGRTYDRYFGDSRFSNFDVTKLSVQYIKTGGQTALGPALAFASGIISQHDEGSRVIVLTDSLPNYGILSTHESRICYKEISQVFQDCKATMGIFRIINNEFEQAVKDIEFESFIKHNSQIIKVIEISLFPSITQQVLQNTIKSFRNLITHESVAHSFNLTILNDNGKITLNKFKYDNIDYRSLRFITSQSKHWIQLSPEREKLNQSDLLFPVMTQLIIEYDDIWTKQKCLFMSYIQQNIRRKLSNKNLLLLGNSDLSQTHQESIAQVLQSLNMQNIQSIFDMQCIKAFEDEREIEGVNKKTYRNELKNQVFTIINNIQINSIDCQSVNDYTSLKNRIIDQGQNTQDQELEEEKDYQSL